MLQNGTIIHSRYRVVRNIGQGGMGAVYEATDERLGTTVALKQTLVTEDHLKKAFEREARLLAALRHPSLPRVIDHFIDPVGQFLVMDFVPGKDLGMLLQELQKPFPVGAVLRWADQWLDALIYLHTHNPPIIHRDIKPQNAKVMHDGRLMLLDFGLAKGTAHPQTRITSGGSIMAYTPTYAPLEQIQGTGTDHRTDLYSLGATLYHLFTARTPVDALTRSVSFINDEPDPQPLAHTFAPNVPPEVSRVIQWAMALRANERPTDAVTMRNALQEAGRHRRATGPMGPQQPATGETLIPEKLPPSPPPQQPPSRPVSQPHHQKPHSEHLRPEAAQAQGPAGASSRPAGGKVQPLPPPVIPQAGAPPRPQQQQQREQQQQQPPHQQQQRISRRVSPLVVVLWTMANTLAWTVCWSWSWLPEVLFLPIRIEAIIGAITIPGVPTAVWLLAAGLFFGLGTGFVQWLVVQHYLRPLKASLAWLSASILGGILAIPSSSIISGIMISLVADVVGIDSLLATLATIIMISVVSGLVAGFAIGFSQWLAMRRKHRWPAWWIIVSIGGGAVGFAAIVITAVLVYFVGNEVIGIGYTNTTAVGGILGGGAGGILYGLITGPGLMRVLRRG
jgi:serine/threonine protein kinase